MTITINPTYPCSLCGNPMHYGQTVRRIPATPAGNGSSLLFLHPGEPEAKHDACA